MNTEPSPMTNDELLTYAQAALREIGEDRLAQSVLILWNSRLRTTAGRAMIKLNIIDLNPRLMAFGHDEIHRTIRHELAHLVAWKRYQHNGHGAAWRAACAELGIPNESVTHDLPMPKSTQRKNYRYKCPNCDYSFDRVRRMKKPSACGICCKEHNGGKYTAKFQLEVYRLEYS